MKKNRILLIIAVLLLPIVVISFEEGKTNFIIEKNTNNNQNIEIKVLVNNEIKKIDLEEYVVGVVAAEMPASFNIEALKAQAIASRSYVLFKKIKSSENYDITDGIKDQVYIDKEKMQTKWKQEYEKYYNKISDAVKSTEGQVMTYNDKIIEALYFSMSGGYTEDASSVFGETIEYLKPTESKYDNENITNYKVTKTYEENEFKLLLSLKCEKIKIEEIIRDESYYVKTIDICNKTFKGTEIRSLLSLRSANFDIDFNKDIQITTYGYGHGVGLSQYGANGYAENNWNYIEILKHYYNGIEIKNIKDVYF